MRIFMTGASGFIGAPALRSLKEAGHAVSGLARSDEAASKLQQMGARVVRGELTDLDVLQHAAADSDGVLHLAFLHDFSSATRAVGIDQAAIRAMLAGLGSSGKAFVGSTGTLSIRAAREVATERDLAADPNAWRAPAEELVLHTKGVHGMVIRLAQIVHGANDHVLLPELIKRAKQNSASLYPGEGTNVWQAVFRDDAAELYRLAVERGEAGSRYHGIAEPAILFRDIALSIGQHLNLPTKSVSPAQAAEQMGWIAQFASMGVPTSSDWTQATLGWRPAGPTLFEDLQINYF